MRELLILAVIGLGTYAMRAVFLVRATTDPPARLARLLPHVGPAVLAAITLPALLAPRGEMSWTESVPSLLAGLVAWALWRRTTNLPVALFGGLALWWLATWLLTVL
ncbi:AzlD domain-containing protein [Actinomycetospora sp.]|jgi:branched-subunit amino acid transport protein|uniref:AzlD domain-containing protein n=1 Tax=Actinomycetospora sp. TaxID=1872135 RepID=UPI002F41EFAA